MSTQHARVKPAARVASQRKDVWYGSPCGREVSEEC